ncbi:MAG: MFS transporter, partial [Acidimicrobiia bacterium]
LRLELPVGGRKVVHRLGVGRLSRAAALVEVHRTGRTPVRHWKGARLYSSVRDRPTPSPSASSGSYPGDPPGPEDPGAPEPRGIDGNVVALGATSFFTDISSEMVNAVLPMYLIIHLGFSPLAFGIFDGAYQGMTGLLRIAGGVWADRRGRYKEVAGLGYAISAVAKIGLLASSTVAPVTGVLLADRTGKSLRTAPRDALISLSSSPARLAESFGIHRALDTAGALIGPVLAFFLLQQVPDAYDAVFVTSFLVALIGLGVLFCFVRNRAPAARGNGPVPSLRAAAHLLRRRGYRRLVMAGALLGLVTMSDAFIYLSFQRRAGMGSTPFPLLFVGTALTYLLLAIPVGRLADRVGRIPVFLAGHVLLVACYLVLRSAGPGLPAVLGLVGLLGAYYAATDGVLMALTSAAVPPSLRTSGLALLATVTAMSRFIASVVFGLIWKLGHGPEDGVTIFLVGLVVALPATVALLAGDDRPTFVRSAP